MLLHGHLPSTVMAMEYLYTVPYRCPPGCVWCRSIFCIMVTDNCTIWQWHAALEDSGLRTILDSYPLKYTSLSRSKLRWRRWSRRRGRRKGKENLAEGDNDKSGNIQAHLDTDHRESPPTMPTTALSLEETAWFVSLCFPCK